VTKIVALLKYSGILTGAPVPGERTNSSIFSPSLKLSSFSVYTNDVEVLDIVSIALTTFTKSPPVAVTATPAD
jgi:hypothetical protein